MSSASGRRESLALVALVPPVLLLSMDISVLLLALPSIASDLDAGPTEQLWMADIYGFTLAGCLITMGTLGDRIGRRRLLLSGAGAFAALSVAAAYAPGPLALIVARGLLGVAGATIMPSTLATIASMFRDSKRRESAIALIFGCFLVGGMLGPVLGGVLLHFFWWGSVFLIGVPVMALLMVLGPRLLPESSDPDAGRLDLVSVGLALTGVLTFVGGIKDVGRDGWSASGVAMVAVGLVVGVTFVARQRRVADPLLDLSVLRLVPVSVCLSVNVLGGVVLGGTFLVVTQYLQLVRGLDPLLAGLWLILPTGAMAVGTFAGPAVARRTRPVVVMAGGMLLGGIGLGLITQVPAGDHGLLIGALSLALFGFGLPGGLGINVIVSAVPPEKAGGVSGLSSTGQELGVALGLAALGGAGLWVYRHRLAEDLPGGVPASTLASARDSLAAAVASGDDVVVDAARNAFTAGLHAVAAASSLIVLGLAVLIAVTLRRLPSPAAPHGPDEAVETTPVGSGGDWNRRTGIPSQKEDPSWRSS